MLAYWVLVITLIVFLVVGGYLNFESWVITFPPPSLVSIPFAWLIVPFIVLGIIGTYAAWSGYPLKGLPRPKAPLSQYNPFKRKKQETRDANEAK